MNRNGLWFTLDVAELPAGTLRVINFTLNEGLSSLFDLQIQVVSFNMELDLNAQLLKMATLTVLNSGVVQRTVTGVISEFQRGQTGVRRTYWTVRIRPEAWKLTLTQNSRIFHFQSTPDMMKTLLREDRVKNAEQYFVPHPSREYITQKRETNWQFLNRITAQDGIIYWFEEEKPGSATMFCSDSHQGILAGPALVYNPEPGSPWEDNIISDMRMSAVMVPDRLMQKDRIWSNPEYRLSHKAQKPGETAAGYEVFDSYGRFQYDEEGVPSTNARMQAINSRSMVGDGTSNCIKVMPGKRFSVSRHPQESLNTEWQVVSVTHSGAMPASAGEETDAGATTLTNQIRFIPMDIEWKPEYIHKPLADGPEVATVVGPEGEEIYTNDYGCVRVAFHWNRYDANDDKASGWIRVAQGWNGAAFGFMAIPRMGHEVIVTYLDGDIDRPLITGCVYNPASPPPLNLPVHKTRTTFKSQTYKGTGFNEFRFDDATGNEEVFVHAQKNMNTQVLHNRTTHVGNNHAETVGVNKTVSVGKVLNIDAGTEITLTCGASAISMNKAGKVVITGTEFLFESSGPVRINGKDVDIN